MKTPDEIKKGLECCWKNRSDIGVSVCNDCPYLGKRTGQCKVELGLDTLALIRQLEAERDAAILDMTIAAVDACDVCKHTELIIDEAPCQSCTHILRGGSQNLHGAAYRRRNDNGTRPCMADRWRNKQDTGNGHAVGAEDGDGYIRRQNQANDAENTGGMHRWRGWNG